MYALPYEYYEKYKVRRYGFHGTSHRFVSEEAAKMMDRPYDQTKTITCHLGNGGSVCAVRNGKSIDTTMGFTPLEGLVMGTRAGDVDVAAVTYIMKKENLTVDEMDNILNKKPVYWVSPAYPPTSVISKKQQNTAMTEQKQLWTYSLIK